MNNIPTALSIIAYRRIRAQLGTLALSLLIVSFAYASLTGVVFVMQHNDERQSTQVANLSARHGGVSCTTGTAVCYLHGISRRVRCMTVDIHGQWACRLDNDCLSPFGASSNSSRSVVQNEMGQTQMCPQQYRGYRNRQTRTFAEHLQAKTKTAKEARGSQRMSICGNGTQIDVGHQHEATTNTDDSHTLGLKCWFCPKHATTIAQCGTQQRAACDHEMCISDLMWTIPARG